jgi:hypothetical protein
VYKVVVSATDNAGNVGSVTCDTIIRNEKKFQKQAKKNPLKPTDPKLGPFFKIASTEFTTDLAAELIVPAMNIFQSLGGL